jgi:hypothetical protein
MFVALGTGRMEGKMSLAGTLLDEGVSESSIFGFRLLIIDWACSDPPEKCCLAPYNSVK